MKSLQTFIIEKQIENLNEGLLDKLKGWFKNLFKSQKTLEKHTLDVNTKNVKGSKESVELSEIEKNEEELNLIKDPQVGFPIMTEILTNKNKYLVKDLGNDKQEYKPMVDRYFYVNEGNKYAIGLIMYDETLNNDNGYVNLLNFEVIAKVDNKSIVEKFINTNFEDTMKKKYKGSQYVAKHPRLKSILKAQLGYKESEEDTNILLKEFK